MDAVGALDPAAPGAPSPEAERAQRRFFRAWNAGDLDAADTALASLSAVPADLAEPAAMLRITQMRWNEAAELLTQIPQRDARLEALLRYARNLAAFERCRPDVYRRLIETPPTQNYDIDTPAVGLPRILRTTPGAPPRCMTPGGDPAKFMDTAWQALACLRSNGVSIACLGIGDGHLLARFAADPPKTLLGNEQVIVVIEPDVDLVRACLMLHDYSGDAQPIPAQRFVWLIGADWEKQLRRLIDDEPQLPLPPNVVPQSEQAGALHAAYHRIVADLEQRDTQMQQASARYYAGLGQQAIVDALLGKAGRPPRAVLCTSRFTTVLQFSTRDTARALEALGWETRVLIERAPHLSLTIRSIRETIDTFKPDLVLIIDHLRHQYSDLFPPELPYVCWIQDNLANLTSTAAGRSVTKRDFVIGPWVRNYVRDYGYPESQCITTQRLTSAVATPPLREPDGDDLMYVSNHGRTPQERLEEVIHALAAYPQAQQLAKAVAKEVFAIYSAGRAIFEPREMDALVARVALELRIEDPTVAGSVSWQLFEKVNNALYRQQALTWAADIADRLGLRLAIYGHGWQGHPRFAKYARGVIGYGQPLADATRRARFSLMLEPYFATSHQRVLDGWASGGFFLLRRRPIDELQAQWMDWLDRLPQSVTTLDDARAALSPETFAQFQALHQTMHALHPSYASLNLIALHRQRQAEDLGFLMATPPSYHDTSFASSADLERLATRFIEDPDERFAIAEAQRRFVLQHFTYEAGMRRVIEQIAAKIASEPPAASA